MSMDALTEMYRSAYFNSLKQIVIDKAKAVIKTNSYLKQEQAELIAACDEFWGALGKEEINADAWVCAVASAVSNYGDNIDAVSCALQVLCDTDPSKFVQE